MYLPIIFKVSSLALGHTAPVPVKQPWSIWLSRFQQTTKITRNLQWHTNFFEYIYVLFWEKHIGSPPSLLRGKLSQVVIRNSPWWRLGSLDMWFPMTYLVFHPEFLRPLGCHLGFLRPLGCPAGFHRPLGYHPGFLRTLGSASEFLKPLVSQPGFLWPLVSHPRFLRPLEFPSWVP